MFAVMAPASAQDRTLFGRNLELGFCQHLRQHGSILRFELPGIDCNSAADELLQYFVDFKQLGHETPAPRC